MGYEIDFVPVGEGEKSGDAIAIRYGNLHGPREQQKVIIVDGGFQSSADDLIQLVKTHYNTTHVDLVVSTHPDQDHVSGLSKVLDELSVGELWMHLPWNHDSEVANYVKHLGSSISRGNLQKSLDAACSLEALAKKRGIPITEPFTGLSFDGTLFVVGPTKEFYAQLLPEFRGQPQTQSVISKFIHEGVELVKRIAESLDIETLTDDGETSAENESSVILLLDFEGKRSLLNADAGQRALTVAADVLERSGYDPKSFNFIQVPHHGSHHNVGPTILNRLIGPKLTQEQSLRTAFVSVAKNSDEKHPNKKVTNAFRRRGAPVHATSGSTKCHPHNAPDRGWQSSTPLPLYSEVEE